MLRKRKLSPLLICAFIRPLDRKKTHLEITNRSLYKAKLHFSNKYNTFLHLNERMSKKKKKGAFLD